MAITRERSYIQILIPGNRRSRNGHGFLLSGSGEYEAGGQLVGGMSTLMLYPPEDRVLDLAKLRRRDYELIHSLHNNVVRADRY
jgi:hypothetical protein